MKETERLWVNPGLVADIHRVRYSENIATRTSRPNLLSIQRRR